MYRNRKSDLLTASDGGEDPCHEIKQLAAKGDIIGQGSNQGCGAGAVAGARAARAGTFWPELEKEPS